MGMVHSERELRVREIQDDEEFGVWLSELTHDYPVGGDMALEDRHLVLTDELGDWIGGLRFLLRGGVAQIVEIGVTPEERGRGHAIRLLEGFEHTARDAGAHLIEFWTDKTDLEPILGAVGWRRVATRPGYVGGRTWYLLEKHLAAPPVAG
jgi:GNAT superfamily N-acetyltransferase